MKKGLRLLALVLVLVLLAGCTGGTETFTCRELTMNVPSGMEDVSGQSDFADYTFTLDSTRLAIFGLQESLADYPVLAEYDLASYADLVIQANGLSTTAVARNGYFYFDYEYETGDTVYKYLTAVYQSGEGFWMVQISAPEARYDEAAFFGYLDSVRFN